MRAHHEAAALARLWEERRSAWQADLDAEWQGLKQNDPRTLLGVLAVAFEDNEARAAAVGVAGNEVSLAVLVPGTEVLPERKPGVTAAGNLSLKKFSKTEAAQLYKELVAGHVLATVRETLAVAVAINSVRITAVRTSTMGTGVEALMAARFTREAMSSAVWHTSSATDVINTSHSELLVTEKGVTKALSTLDLSHQPELRALVEAVTFEP